VKTITLFLEDDKITPNEFRAWVDHVTRKLCGRYPNPDGPWETKAARNGTLIDRLQDAGGWSSPAMPLRYVESARVANQGVQLD
jgi:hypothetical protein